MGLLPFLGAKITEIGIQNPKLIVTNDYQQFLAHFEWFLSLFQIYDIKHKFLLVKFHVSKNGIFWAKNLIFRKKNLGYFCPQIFYVKNLGQNGL